MTQDETGATAGSTLSAVTDLMERRRRFEGWIAALEAKRSATPERVFTRVHADYTARLHQVVEELSAHADDLRTELEVLEGRHALIEQDQQRAEDERAEAELRAHVGELTPEDWQKLAATSDDRLAELAMSRTDVEQEITRTRELLDEAERPAVAAAAPEVEEVPVPAEPEPVAEAAAPVAEPAPVEAPPMEVSASILAAEQQILELESAAPPAAAVVEEPVAPAPRVSAPVAAPPAAAEPAPQLNRFDELAFLSSVVDAPAGEVEHGPSDRPDEKARRNSFAQEQAQVESIVNLSDKRRTPLDHMKAMSDLEQEGDPPFASNVTGNYPIKLTENPAEGTKTLKCGDCGSMNYPTEWYCERCGAELASL